MELPRIIPVLLLKGNGLYKTQRFKEPKYIGDPLNAVKIFNDKEVDELIFLDINASREKKAPPLTTLKEIAGECFMPLCYGGGVNTLEQIREIISSGVEKISINTAAIENPEFVERASDTFGSSTIVVSIDVKKSIFGKYEVVTRGGTMNTGKSPLKVAVEMSRRGAGEILLNSIDRDGMMNGYDIELLRSVTKEVNIPVIASGGAGSVLHMIEAIKSGGASAVAAGSMFVMHGKHRAILISYPSQGELKKNFSA